MLISSFTYSWGGGGGGFITQVEGQTPNPSLVTQSAMLLPLLPKRQTRRHRKEGQSLVSLTIGSIFQDTLRLNLSNENVKYGDPFE